MTSPRIEERIAHRLDELTPVERRAAAALLEHLDDLATYRATELAQLAGVSKATMSRLFRRLGFADFDEVRGQLRAARAAGEPRDVSASSDLDLHVETERAALHTTLTQPAIADAAASIAHARRVLVIGWRNSYPVALHLRQQLAQVREAVSIAPVPGQTLGEELVGFDDRDAVVVVGFRRRPAGFAGLLAEIFKTGAPLVLVTDPGGGRYRGVADVWLECPIEGALAFDSYAAAMSLVAVIADGVLRCVERSGRDRITAISESYSRMSEVER